MLIGVRGLPVYLGGEVDQKDQNAISQQECDLSARIERHQLELLEKKNNN